MGLAEKKFGVTAAKGYVRWLLMALRSVLQFERLDRGRSLC